MNQDRYKITLVISSLTCGGAERVLVLLANGFIEAGHQISVVTLSNKDTDFYQLPSGVKRIDLDLIGESKSITQAISSNFQRVTLLRKAIQGTKPDLVISFLRITNILTLLASINVSYPVIVTEHNDAKIFSYGKLWESLRHLTYRYCSLVVSVSQGVDNSLEPLPKSKRAVIYNPILIPENNEKDILPSTVDPNKNWLVSMGRLTKQKGYDLLLKAFQPVAKKHPDWQLLILGQGELKEELETIKDELGLANKVVFTGSVRNPFAILRKARLFVMASRNEGFPMAHGEALACGCPVIATDCPSGPREMIRDGVDGVLVPNGDISALSTAMEKLISDEKERKRLATNAPEVTQRFSLEKIVEKWEELFSQIVNNK